MSGRKNFKQTLRCCPMSNLERLFELRVRRILFKFSDFCGLMCVTLGHCSTYVTAVVTHSTQTERNHCLKPATTHPDSLTFPKSKICNMVSTIWSIKEH